jgi:tRNA modification GTPase
LREHIQIDGMPLHIIDTAGLRESPDLIEQEGIRRAWAEIEKADRILLVVDSSTTLETNPAKLWPDFADKLPSMHNITIIQNKSDLSGLSQDIIEGDPTIIPLSAQNNAGIDLLRQHLKQAMGYQGAVEGGFMARRRHIDALNRANNCLLTGKYQLESQGAGELLAEDLRQAQQALGEITGEFTPDDLLGEIFSSFCIGK